MHHNSNHQSIQKEFLQKERFLLNCQLYQMKKWHT